MACTEIKTFGPEMLTYLPWLNLVALTNHVETCGMVFVDNIQ